MLVISIFENNSFYYMVNFYYWTYILWITIIIHTKGSSKDCIPDNILDESKLREVAKSSWNLSLYGHKSKITKHQNDTSSIALPTVWWCTEYRKKNLLPSYSYQWRNKALWADIVHPHYPTTKPQNACLVDHMGIVAHIIDPNWLNVALLIDCKCSRLMHQ